MVRTRSSAASRGSTETPEGVPVDVAREVPSRTYDLDAITLGLALGHGFSGAPVIRDDGAAVGVYAWDYDEVGHAVRLDVLAPWFLDVICPLQEANES